MLRGADDLSTLFSFTRAYFLVDMETPAAVVSFLSSLLPRKPKAELYTMIGLQKQGKTLFYRDFLHHLAHSRDAFDIAPGIKGMVMRSEERRVGKECVSTGRSRWSRCH